MTEGFIRCILTEEGMEKKQLGQNLLDKGPQTKQPRAKTVANNWERICAGGFCPGFLY